MLLQIQVYPSVENSNGNNGEQQSIVPVITHYINTSMIITNNNINNNNNNNNDIILWSVGRKQGNYHITTDRSVSREHLRLLLPAKHIKTDTQLEQKNESIIIHNTIRIQNIGKLGSSLVIEEQLPIVNENHEEKDDNNIKNNEINDDSSATTVDESHISSSRHQISQQQRSQKQSQQQSSIDDVIELSTITKHLTINNQSNYRSSTTSLSYNVRLQPISFNDSITISMLDTNNKTIIKQQDQQQQGEEDDTDIQQQQQQQYNHPNRIIIQCGKVGTTIVITRLYLNFVLSHTTLKQHDRSNNIISNIYQIGGTIQESLLSVSSSPTNNTTNDDSMTSNNTTTSRTFFITTECKSSPKQITAWCRNIAIVQPTFIIALYEYYQQLFHISTSSSLSSSCYVTETIPFPTNDMIQQHTIQIPNNKRNELQFFTQQPNVQLWSNCTCIVPLAFMDHHYHENNNYYSHEKEMIELVQAVGTKIVTLQSIWNEKYNNDWTTTESTANQDNTILDLYNDETKLRRLFTMAFTDNHPTKVSYFTIDTFITKSQNPKLLKLVFEEFGIPIISSKDIGRTITQQQNIHDRICTYYEKQFNKRSKKRLRQPSPVQEHTQPSKINDTDHQTTNDNEVIEHKTIDMKQSAPRSTRSKRSRRDDQAETIRNNETTISVISETTTPIQETPVQTGNRGTRQSSRRRQAIAPNDELYVPLKSNNDDNDSPIATSNDKYDSPVGEPMENMTDIRTNSTAENITVTKENNVLQADQYKKSKHIEEKRTQNQIPHVPPKVGAPEIIPKGWLTVYPQGPERKRMYYEKQKVNAKARIEPTDESDSNDNTKIICNEPARTVYVKGLIRTTTSSNTSNQLHFNGSNRPDYKAFRKNHVPEPILQNIRLQTYCATKGLPIMNDANESQQRKHIEAQQRRLDDLFR